VIVDDPHSVDQAASDAQRTAAVEWWNGAMSTRHNDPSKGHKVVIQQRLHEADLTGDLLIRGGYEHLCLPAEFEPDRRCSTSIGWTDPRTTEGELLCPQRMDQAKLDELKKTLGSYRYAGQFQQRPAPAGGGMLKSYWWGSWQLPGMNLPPIPVRLPDGTIEMRHAVELPTSFYQMLQSWDMAFKGTKNSDYVVGMVIAALGADRYLLDLIRDRLDLPGTLAAVRWLTAKWRNAHLKLIGDKANGPAVIQSLKKEIHGFVEVNPEGARCPARRQQVRNWSPGIGICPTRC
jgi:hypothetical protein